MQKRIGKKEILFAFAAATFVLGYQPLVSRASDHNESPLVKQDVSMDLTDLYIFNSGGGETTAIVCWSGLNDSRPQPDADGVYNPRALYTLNIDNNGDNLPDIQVYWRFGTDASGNVGVQVQNLPGSTDTVSGPVEQILNGGGGTRVWSGHADDPFFFDVQGYLDTLATGTLMIRNDRALVHGLNVTAIALEMNTAAMRVGNQDLHFWITSARN